MTRLEALHTARALLGNRFGELSSKPLSMDVRLEMQRIHEVNSELTKMIDEAESTVDTQFQSV